MDEKKDLAVDERAAEGAVEAIDDAAEQSADVVDSAEPSEGAVEVSAEDDPVDADNEDSALEGEAEETGAEKPVEDNAVVEEPEKADVAETAEAVEEAAAPQAPAKPAKKPATFIKMGDLVIVGVLSIILGVLLALPSFLGMTSGEKTSEGSSGATAATVNGVAISEDEVTKYVMDFRSQQGLDNDDSWGEWMVGYGYTPEDLRSDTIDYFVNRELLKQAIAEQGIVVEDSKVDEYIATITEQVGGEEAFQKALEQEGLDLETYRSEILFSLQQQALAEKVAPADGSVDDAQVLEVVKMYFPDSVDSKATSLEGVDPEIVDQVRSMLSSSAMQQAFSQWMDDYRSKAKIVIVEMPASLPYAIDLAPYQEKAKQAAQDGSLAASSDSAADGDAIEIVEDAESSGDAAEASGQSANSEGKKTE